MCNMLDDFSSDVLITTLKQRGYDIDITKHFLSSAYPKLFKFIVDSNNNDLYHIANDIDTFSQFSNGILGELELRL